MKITKELKGLSSGELQERMKEFKKELLKLNVQASTGTGSSNPGKLRQAKKNIARILTLLNQKEASKHKEALK